MAARSCAVGVLRWALSTAIGTSHESQVKTAKRHGVSYSAYHFVVRASSHNSQVVTRLYLDPGGIAGARLPPPAFTNVQDPRALVPYAQPPRLSHETARGLVERLVRQIERTKVHTDDTCRTNIARRAQRFFG